MEQEIETIKESFENIPDEIKHYIYSDSFNDSFKKMCEDQRFSPDDINKLKTSLYSYLAQIESEEQLITTINSVSKNPESNQKVMNWVQEKVTDKILEILTNAYLDSDDSPEGEVPVTEVSVTQSLASIKERLSSPSTVAPITRDHSFSKNESVVEKVVEKPKIDPYRELPSE
jgi:hypothetical protein